MGRIIRFEFRKLFRQRSFYICTIVTVALLILGVFALKLIARTTSMAMEMTGWEYAAEVISNSQFTMLLGIFTALFICDDFDQQTLKNIYAKGYSRRTVFIGKYISSLCAMYMMYLFDIVVALISGTVAWGIGSPEDAPRTLLLQGIVLIGYHAFFFAISIILGRTGGSIAIGVVASTMISLILTIFDMIIKSKKFSLTDYWLDAFLVNTGDAGTAAKTIAASIIGALLYAAAFIAAGYAFNRKKQV